MQVISTWERKCTLANTLFKRLAVCWCVGLALLCAGTAQAAIVYVAQNSTGAQDGTSWDTAFHTIGAAMSAAQAAVDGDDGTIPGDEIWVAAGTYSEAVTIKTGVHLFGGFAGNEELKSSRNWATNTTVIDGSGNTCPVTMVSGSSMLSMIDGFTIQNGHATHGGAITCTASHAQISNNLITGCSADDGAAVFASGAAALTIAGNIIAGNNVGVYCFNSTANLSNNTIINNTSGGIYSSSSSTTIANNIIDSNAYGISVSGGSANSISNCLHGNQSNYIGISAGSTDISSDPQIIDSTSGDYHINSTSPCIEAGDNSYVQAGIVDLDGNPRLFGPKVDIGAHEYRSAITGSTSRKKSGGIHTMSTARTMSTLSAPTNVVYVNNACTGSTHDGTSWDTAYLTVQNGINSAVSGYEVWVAAGSGAYNGCITLKAGVGVYGGFVGTEMDRSERDVATNVTILDGGSAGSVVTTPSSCTSTTVLDGFTIRNGSGTVWGSNGQGGGIFCVGYGSECSPTISNNIITLNSVNYGGAGIFCYQSTPTITNNTISSNNMTNTGNGYGGAIFCSHTGAANIISNTIGSNTSYFGGGIALSASNAYISGNTISSNVARHSGGGIISASTSHPTIVGNTITGNSTNTYMGAGLSCVDSSTPIVAYNSFLSNTATTSGGAISCTNTSLATIYGNVMAGNSALVGGALYVNGNSPSVFNNTITQNTATTAGGGVWSQSSSSVYTNNIIAFNQSGFANSSATPTFSHNNVYGNTAYNFSGIADPTNNNGNISIDPLFVNGASAPYDLHLLATSPCIGAGDNSVVFTGMLDIDGQPRINGTNVDIGADELYVADIPTFSPAAGTYNATQNVTISSTTQNVTIYYTTDGTTPTKNSTKYTAPVVVSTNTTINAIACSTAYSPSAVATASYIIDTIAPTPGTASVAAVTSTSPIAVTYSRAADNQGGSGLAHVELWYKLETGAWTDTGLRSTGGSGAYAFAPPGNSVGTYHFALVAQDNAGNRSATPTGNGDCATYYEADLGICQFSSIFAQ